MSSGSAAVVEHFGAVKLGSGEIGSGIQTVLGAMTQAPFVHEELRHRL